MDALWIGIALAIVAAIVTLFVNHYGVRLLDRRKPLQIHVETDPRLIWGDAPDWDPYACVIEKPVDQIDPPPSAHCRLWWSWAQEIGGVDAFDTVVQVTIVGESSTTVVIEGLRLKIRDRKEALHGTALVCRTGGADMTPRGLDIDLDLESVTVVDDGGEPMNGPLRLSVRKGEPEVLQIRAHAELSFVQWSCDLVYLLGGRRRVEPISPSQNVFSTTGLANATKVEWRDGRWTPLEA